MFFQLPRVRVHLLFLGGKKPQYVNKCYHFISVYVVNVIAKGPKSIVVVDLGDMDTASHDFLISIYANFS